MVYKWETSEIPSARKDLFNASPNSRQEMHLIPFWKLDLYLFSWIPQRKRFYTSVLSINLFLKFRPSFYFYFFYFVGVRELLVSTIPVKLLDIVKITILSLPLVFVFLPNASTKFSFFYLTVPWTLWMYSSIFQWQIEGIVALGAKCFSNYFP